MLELTDQLYKAVESSDVEVVREFMNKGANVNLVCSHGRTALGRASQLGNLAIVCLLLDAEKFGECPSQNHTNAESSNLYEVILAASSPKSLPVTTTASSVCHQGTSKTSLPLKVKDEAENEISASSSAGVESCNSLPLGDFARNDSTIMHRFNKSISSPVGDSNNSQDKSESGKCSSESLKHALNLKKPISDLNSTNPSCSSTVISSQIVGNGSKDSCSSGARPKTHKKHKCNKLPKKIVIDSSSSLSFEEDDESTFKKCNAFVQHRTVLPKKTYSGFSSDSDLSDKNENVASTHNGGYNKSSENAHCKVQEVFKGNSCYLSDSYSEVLGSPCDIINSSSSEQSWSQNDLGHSNYNSRQWLVPSEKNNFHLGTRQLATSEPWTPNTATIEAHDISPSVCDITDAFTLDNSSSSLVSSSQPLDSSYSKDNSSTSLSIYATSRCCDKVEGKPKTISHTTSFPTSKSNRSFISCYDKNRVQPAAFSSSYFECCASLRGSADEVLQSPPTCEPALGERPPRIQGFGQSSINGSSLRPAVTSHSTNQASSVERIPASVSASRLHHRPVLLSSQDERLVDTVGERTPHRAVPIPGVISNFRGNSLHDHSSAFNNGSVTPNLPPTSGIVSVERIPYTDCSSSRPSTVTNVTWSLDESLLGPSENNTDYSHNDSTESVHSHTQKTEPKVDSTLSSVPKDAATANCLSASDSSPNCFPKPLAQRTTVIRNVRRQPNIGYYVMAHEDISDSTCPVNRSPPRRSPFRSLTNLPPSPRPGRVSPLNSATTSKIDHTAVSSVSRTLATTHNSDNVVDANPTLPLQSHCGSMSARATTKYKSLSRDNAPLFTSVQRQSSPLASACPPYDLPTAGSSAHLSQCRSASAMPTPSSLLMRSPEHAFTPSSIDRESYELGASSRSHRTSDSSDDSSPSRHTPLSSDSDDDNRLLLKRKRLRHSKKELQQQGSPAGLARTLSSLDTSRSPLRSRQRFTRNPLPGHGTKSYDGLLTQKKQKKHKEQDCKNNDEWQEQVEEETNCLCHEDAELQDQDLYRNDESEFPGLTQDVTEGEKSEATSPSMAGGWSVAQWYNSRWGAELRAQYQSVGAAWPWALTAACDCDVVDRHGYTALHYAAHAGHDHIITVLLNAGASVDRTNSEELTALHLATQRGALTVLDTLLRRGAAVNSRGRNKTTALHMAATRGFTALVDTLLSHGAYMNSLDTWERTPLMGAASHGHVDTAKLLVERGAALNVHDIRGYTALCEAVWIKCEPMVQLLLDAGATAPQSQYLLHYTVQHRNLPLTRLLLERGWIVNLKDVTGAMPLMIAARTSSPETMDLLLQHGANPNQRHWVTGCSALHCAVEGTRDEQHVQFAELFQLLVSAGAHLSVSAQLDGDTPLYRALLLQKIRAAELLIRHGASLQCGTPILGLELLRVAVYGNNRRLALVLVLAGCPLRPCRWLDAGPFPAGTLHHTIARLRANPFRLFDVSRIVVRRLLGERLVQTAPLLPIPPLLQRALLIVGDEEPSEEE